jgi:hypothetical protein
VDESWGTGGGRRRVRDSREITSDGSTLTRLQCKWRRNNFLKEWCGDDDLTLSVVTVCFCFLRDRRRRQKFGPEPRDWTDVLRASPPTTLIYTPQSILILFLLSGILFLSVLSSVSCSLLCSTPRPYRFCGTPPRILPRSAAYLIVTCSRASVSVYRNDCQIIHTPRLNSTGIQLPFFIGHGYSSVRFLRALCCFVPLSN